MPHAVQWIYHLEQDIRYETHLKFGDGRALLDRAGVRRLELHPDGSIIILKGYAWDGCTPKFNVSDILVGTPDGVPHVRTQRPKTYYASLVHDALYQFLPENGDILSRADADDLFHQVLTLHDFAPRQIYYLAVRTFGGLFQKGMRKKRKHDGKVEALGMSRASSVLTVLELPHLTPRAPQEPRARQSSCG